MTEYPPRDLEYETQLEVRLRQLLNDGPKRLHSLVAGSEGAYPTDVLAALRRLRQTGTIKEMPSGVWLSNDSRAQYVEPQIELETPSRRDQADFPEPHPLDFDWRFDHTTLESLDRRIEELGPASVAVLGAPTLFKYLVDRGKRAHLFDRNRQIIEFLKDSGYRATTHCDLFRYSPELQFECVVADPPWYLDYYHAFVATARKLLITDGELLLSVLPRLTRPSAEADRQEIMTLTSRYGFDLVGAESGLLQYISPPFEVEALRIEALDFPIWRSGDLFRYVRTAREIVPSHDIHCEDNQLWHTFKVGPMIVKVEWDGTHKTGNFSFQKVAGAMRLRSVSRRSPLRAAINFWTSRNLALNVSRPDIVCEGLQLLQEGYRSAEIATALMAAEKLNTAEVDHLNELFTILINEAKE